MGIRRVPRLVDLIIFPLAAAISKPVKGVTECRIDELRSRSIILVQPLSPITVGSGREE